MNVSFASQVRLLTGRTLRRGLRAPELVVPNLVIALFFFFVYDGSFGDAAFIESIVGGDYRAFVLPVALLSASVAGTVAGQLLVEDVESGYLRRQLTLPLSRAAIVLAPMIFGAVLVVLQALLVLGMGIALGIDPATGVGGVIAIAGLNLLWGLAFAGLTVAVGLITGSAAATAGATFILFPLLFFTPTFLPREQLRGWLETVATWNPATYLLEAMRDLLLVGWEADGLFIAVAVAGGLAVVGAAWAASVARTRTARG